MAADWGDDGPPLSRALVQRVFCYFVPYWRRALIVLGCIGISAGLALVPALVTKGVIDYLGNPTNGVGPLALLVAGGVAASLAGGLIGVVRTFLQTSISQSIATKAGYRSADVLPIEHPFWRFYRLMP